MSRAAAVLLLVLLSTLACSLDWTGADPTPLPSATSYSLAVVPVTNVLPTQTAAPTQTPAPTATKYTTAGSSAPVVNCTPRTDWIIYTVVKGDTLNSIAQRTGTTAAQLATASCLSNPNLITVGQGVRVPYLPGPLPTWTPARIQRRGYVQINPYITLSNGIYTLQTDSGVAVTWPDAPGTGAQVVEFVFVPDGASYGVQIGLDTNMADGAAVAWKVPAPITGRVYASGRLAGQAQAFVESNYVVVLTGYPDMPTPQGKVEVQPYQSVAGDQYVVVEDTTITLSWAAASQFPLAQVQFLIYFPGTNQYQVLGTDNNMADGAAISWRVPVGTAGQIIANGFYPGQIKASITSNGIGIEGNKPTPQESGTVRVSPADAFDGTTYTVTAGAVVTLSWKEAPFNQIGKVEFIYEPDGGAPVVIGTDFDFSDNDANLTWTVPAGTYGTLKAAAKLYENGQGVLSVPVGILAQ